MSFCKYLFAFVLFLSAVSPGLCAEPQVSTSAQATTSAQVTISAIAENSYHSILSEMLKKAYDRIGYQASFRMLPGRRALVWANNGVTDGATGRIAGTEDKYTNLIRISTPLSHFKGYAYTKDYSGSIENWEDLKGLRIGVVRGVRYSEIGTQNMNPRFADNIQELLLLLEHGLVDVIISSELTAEIAIALHFNNSDIHTQGSALFSAPLYHFVHFKNRNLVSQLDRALKEMEQKGELKAIYQHELHKILGNQ